MSRSKGVWDVGQLCGRHPYFQHHFYHCLAHLGVWENDGVMRVQAIRNLALFMDMFPSLLLRLSLDVPIVWEA